MRFNGKELAALALQPSHKFDKEGILVIREKQDGLFRRGEVSAEKWCRLRGNMLFYFKSRDQYSEPAGVIILEQCTVQLDSSSEDGPYPFSIVFDNDGGILQFFAPTEGERDAWIQAAHMASYEYMRMQLKALHSKLDEKAEKTQIDKTLSESSHLKDPTDLSSESYIEMSLACDNLMCDGDGQPPNPVVIISLMLPNQAQWTTYAQTEVIQRSSNPCFLTTASLRLSDINTPTTKIKLAVYDVRERLTSTMTFLGNAVFSAKSFLTTEKTCFRLSLMSGDGNPVGFISISAWQVLPDSTVESSDSETASNKIFLHDPADQHPAFFTGRNSLKCRPSNGGNLNVLFDNIISQTYRFHTGLGADLSVHEVMGESKFCFTLPQKLIQLFIKEEKDLLHTLTSLGSLKEEWNKRQAELLERHLHLINSYTLALHHIDSYVGANFKPSSVKNSQNLEFVPVNLHVQRMWVHNESIKKSGTYDVITVGAFTAHARRYRHGGLSRLLSQVKQQSEWNSEKLINIIEAVAKIKQLKKCLEEMVEQLVKYASSSNASEMCSLMTDIATKSHQLIGICESSLIDDACSMFEEMRSSSISLLSDIPNLSETAANIRSPVSQMKQMKERSKSLDGTYLSSFKSKEAENCDSVIRLERISVEPKTIIDPCNKLINNKKLDHRKENGSPRSLRRRGVRMTRHGSLKDEKLKPFACAIRSPEVIENRADCPMKQDFEPLENKIPINIKLNTGVNSTTSHLVLLNNARNEEIDFIKPMDKENCTKAGNDTARSRSPDEPEPWDLTQLNIEASVMCMASKVKSLCRCSASDSKAPTSSHILASLNWVDELMPSIRKLNQALDCLLKTANLAHIIYLLMEPVQAAAQQRSIQHRRDIIFVQALTSVIVGLMTKLWCQQIDSCFLVRVCKVGVLAEFEGLLSCLGDEMGMLEDAVVAIDDVSRVAFKLVPALDDRQPSTPNIDGGRLWMTVHIPAPKAVFNLLPPECSKGFTFHVTAVFFNVGINEQASIAERESCSPSCMHSVPLSARKSIACMYTATPNPNRFGDMSLQDKINTDGLEKLRDFYSKYKQVPITAEKGRRPSASETVGIMIPELLDILTAHIHSKKGKNVEILHYASKICRFLGGIRFTSCKSAKDRTSMSVTLEQCIILREQFDLAEPEFLRALECMRCEGTRRENTMKNAGVKKYAFNSLQLMALPKLYRPPAGTYGNVQT